MINQEITTFVHGYINNKLPSVFKNYFNHRQSIESYISNERKIRFLTPTHRSSIGANTIYVKGGQLWNSLTFSDKSNVSPKVFRKAFRSSILPYAVNVLN